MSGLEIFGAVAGVFALVNLGVDVSKKVRKLSRNIKFAEMETDDLATEVSTFSDILALFSNVMEEIGPTFSSEPGGERKSKIARGLVKQSKTSLKDLQTLLARVEPLRSPSKFGPWKKGVAQFNFWLDKETLLYLRARFTVIREMMNLFVGLLSLQKWKKQAEDGSEVSLNLRQKIEIQERLLSNNVVRANDVFEKLQWHHKGVEDATRMNLEALEDLLSLKTEIIHSTCEHITSPSIRPRLSNSTRGGTKHRRRPGSNSRVQSWSSNDFQSPRTEMVSASSTSRTRSDSTAPTTPSGRSADSSNSNGNPRTIALIVRTDPAPPERPSVYGAIVRSRHENDIETTHGLWNPAATPSVEVIEVPPDIEVSPSPQLGPSPDAVPKMGPTENKHRMANLQDIQTTRARLKSGSKASTPNQGELIRKTRTVRLCQSQQPTTEESSKNVHPRVRPNLRRSSKFTPQSSSSRSTETPPAVSSARSEYTHDDPNTQGNETKDTESKPRTRRLATLVEESSSARSARKHKISNDETSSATGHKPAGPTKRFSNTRRRSRPS